MDVDDQALASFIDATHASEDQAQFFLEASGGSYERALSMFYEQSGVSAGVASPRAHPPDVPPRPRAPAGSLGGGRGGMGGGAVNAYHAGGVLPPPLQLLNAVLGAPFVVIGGGVRLLARSMGFAASLAGTVARCMLPARVTAALGRTGRALAAAGTEAPPAAAAAEFVQQFAERYGNVRPLWQECGWNEAASRAHGEGKFLFAYLHSSQHQDTDVYCHDTICSPEFVAFVNQHFICWGGDLRRSDTFRLASSLRVASYPYAALLAFSGPRARLITCVEGKMGPAQLREVLQAGINDHGTLLWQEQAERQQRETDRRLREEQDAEYLRSLEADQQREAARVTAQREAEAAQRAVREAAERARAEVEAAEQQRTATEAALRQRKSQKQLALPEEPAVGTPGATFIRLRLPDGSSHQRRFMATDPLQAVYDFADTLEAVNTLRYSLVTTFPRRVYAQESAGQSLQELDLVPQAVLLMQPEDD